MPAQPPPHDPAHPAPAVAPPGDPRRRAAEPGATRTARTARPGRPGRSTRLARLVGVVVAAGLLVAACSDGGGGNGGDGVTTGTLRGGWDTAALERLRPHAEALAAGEVGCEGFDAHPFEQYQMSFELARLPSPLASAGCTTADDGDLTFEAFRDEAHARRFLERKRELICDRGREIAPDTFPGLPYVDGGDWILEPDDDATARLVGEALGLPARNACDPAGPEGGA